MNGRVVKYWQQWLANCSKSTLLNSAEFRRVFSNFSWLFFDKLVRMGFGLVVGSWVARYLGPNQFGQFNYVISYVWLFSAIAEAGVVPIVVRNIVRNPEGSFVTLSSGFLIQIVGSCLSVIFISLSLILFDNQENSTVTMIILFSLSLLFKPADMARAWFEAHVQSKYVVWVENGVFILCAMCKVWAIFAKASLFTFLYIAIAEYAITGAVLILIYYWRVGSRCLVKPSWLVIQDLIKDSWPLIFSSLAVLLYMRLDQVMIAYLVGPAENGLYSAAVKISEVFYFLPMIIVASASPAIIRLKTTSPALYQQRLRKLYEVLAFLAFLLTALLFFGATPLISLLYGEAYFDAAPILKILSCGLVFTFLGVAFGISLRAENLTFYSMLQTCFGLCANLLLNFLWIPKFGAVGASFATLISYAVATYSPIFFTATRPQAKELLIGSNPLKFIFDFVRGRGFLMRFIQRTLEARTSQMMRNSGVDLIYETRFGFKIFVHPEKLMDIIQTNESCDAEPLLRSLDELLPQLDVVIDVGANIGIVTSWFAKRARHVYSFEPEGSNFRFLKRNVQLNGFCNVTALQKAVGDEAGLAEFCIREAFGHHGFAGPHNSKIVEKTLVPVTTLDEFCREESIDRVSVLKIDVEGHELRVLRGFDAYLSANKVDYILFEHSQSFLQSKEEGSRIYEFLQSHKYVIYNLEQKRMSLRDFISTPDGDFYAVRDKNA